MTAGFGYTAFLASWLGRHHPLKVVLGSLLLAFLAIGGTSLQLDSKLPGSHDERPHGTRAARSARNRHLGRAQGEESVSSLALEVSTGAVRGGTSILFAALGETIAERAGVINLGTEGSVLAGCLAAYAATAASGNPWVGVLGGAAAGAALALVHGVMVVRFRTNQLAMGLVVLFLGLGLTSLFGVAYVSKVIHNFEPWNVPILSRIPWVGEVFFRHDPLVYLSYVLVPLTWWGLNRTRAGLRSCGSRPCAWVVRSQASGARNSPPPTRTRGSRTCRTGAASSRWRS
jgi:ABC-type uncharacterized transport system permease subunit